MVWNQSQIVVMLVNSEMSVPVQRKNVCKDNTVGVGDNNVVTCWLREDIKKI